MEIRPSPNHVSITPALGLELLVVVVVVRLVLGRNSKYSGIRGCIFLIS